MEAHNKKATRWSWDTVSRIFVRLKVLEVSGEKASLINSTFEDSEEEMTGIRATACCNPRTNFHGYFVLGLICFLSFGE